MAALLFYTIGYPGSGKTTMASSLATLLDGEYLRGDKIGLELFRFPTFSQAERIAVHQEMSRRAADALRQGRHVLYDANNNTAQQRSAIVELARQNGAIAIGLWVQTPIDIAKKRAGTARDGGLAGSLVRIIPPHIFDQYVAAFETPQGEHGVLPISGAVPFYLQYRRLQQRLHAHGIRLTRLVQ